MNNQATAISRRNPLSKSQGLSLIELLSAISLVTILLTVGLPSFSNMIDKSRVETTTYNLMTAIQQTRNLAVTRQKRALLKANSEWHKGWELFVDANNNGVRDEDETLVLEQEPIDDISISSPSEKMKVISFINTGESRQISSTSDGAFLAGTLTICSNQSNRGYKLILARGGRTRMLKSKCP